MEYEIVNAVDIAHSKYGHHNLLAFYDESDPLGAVGSVTISDKAYASKTTSCLRDNFQLNAMWVSPSGELWVVDVDGNVFTTFDASFTAPASKHLDYDAGKSQLKWQVTRIHPGQLNGIWGTRDDDVWATSFTGSAYHWDGQQWSAGYELGQAVYAIEGSASDDIYAVGLFGQIYHWNGDDWQRLAVPAPLPDNAAFTDVAVKSKDEVYICGRGGFVLQGNAQDGFVDIGFPEYSWYGIGVYQNRLFLAGGPKGIFEYKEGQFICLKDKGQPVGVFTTDEAVYFIPAEQQPRPWFVRYAPDEERDWLKINC